jgi:hypothetical protein
MSVPEMSLPWLATILMGLALTCAPLEWIVSIARQLRTVFWMLFLSLGSPILPPVRLLAAAIGLAAALPLFSTLIADALPHSFESEMLFLSVTTALIVFLRVALLPGVAMDWSRMQAWEQEVVRRTGSHTLLFLNDQLRDSQSRGNRERLWALSRELARSELSQVHVLKNLPLRAIGLLCFYIAATSLPVSLARLRPELSLWLVFLASFTTFRAFQHPESPSFSKKEALYTSSILLILLLSHFLIPGNGLNSLVKYQASVFIEKISISCSILVLFAGFFGRNFSKLGFVGSSLTSLPLERRYSFLRKVANFSRWLANPGNLVTLFVQLDVVAATLRITLS